jgi:hypothetical protein
MSERIERTLHRWFGEALPRCLSMPGDEGYVQATAIWAMPTGGMPRAVVHCRTAKDVQAAIRAARDCDLPLSVRGGGHDWAGRALCDGIVIDLSHMNGVEVGPDLRSARIAGGAHVSDVLAAVEPLGLAAVTGSVGSVGMAGLTLGGGYGPLIGRFGLALDNLIAAHVVLADGRIVLADAVHEPELFWALRGGGGNFGVVTAMYSRLHPLSSVHSGMLIYPFSEAASVLERYSELEAATPDEMSVQVGFVPGPDGAPVVFVAPTWSGAPEQAEAQAAPFQKLGTLVDGGMATKSYRESLSVFDAFVVNGQRVFMETCWLPELDRASIDVLTQAMKAAVSPGCAIVTHDFKGAASRVQEEATAFGLRRDHVMVEIMTLLAGPPDNAEAQRHHEWARATRQALAVAALPGGYPNLLGRGETERATKSYGRNAGRLVRAKQRYDPEDVFSSAIPLPI